MKNKLDKLVIKKGTIVKLDGIPIELKNDTIVLGNKNNFQLGLSGEVRNSAAGRQTNM